MNAATAWLSVAERGSLLGMHFIVWCYRLLGRRVCLYLLVPIVGYFFLTAGAARRASRGYLRQLHAWSRNGPGAGRAPRWSDSFRHFHEFAVNIIDRVSFLLGDTSRLKTIVHGREHLDRLAQEKRGALVLSAHIGSFDALRVFAEQRGVPVNVAMLLRNARMINQVFTRLNPTLHMRVIDLERPAPQNVFDIRACVQRGELVGILGDRVGLRDDSRISSVSFLGSRVAMPHGAFLLAGVLKCPILLMIALRVDDSTYEIFVELLAEEVILPRDDRPVALAALTRLYAQRLEEYCRLAPYQWFNFYEFWSDMEPNGA